jgi:hypothetical protein
MYIITVMHYSYIYIFNLLHPHQTVFWTVWRDPCFHLKINTNSYLTFRLVISFYAIRALRSEIQQGTIV